ncbi:MAG TPA: dihydrodipicolinate synthase family protein [Cytophagales bacterium]|nr:dihydrodipicolinate synthase family protein [Cytophagales bacterium]
MKWQGVFPAVTTKFTTNDELDLEAFKRNLDAQLAAGVHGIILGGTLGEASTLETEEKYTLVETTVGHVAGKVPVVMNIAEQTTKGAIEAARRAEDHGASGLMMLPPMRYKADDRETVEYYRATANSTSLPIMVYNNPVDYKILVTLDMFDALADCDNIVAVKESTRDLTNITRMANRFGNRFTIFSGVDTLAMESLLMGAQGWVAGLVCAFPAETVAIYNLVQQGRVEEAREIYRWFMPLLELDIHPKLVQYIKLAEQETGIGTEYVRAPRLALEGEERNRTLNIIRTALANRPVLPATELVLDHA